MCAHWPLGRPTALPLRLQALGDAQERATMRDNEDDKQRATASDGKRQPTTTDENRRGLTTACFTIPGRVCPSLLSKFIEHRCLNLADLLDTATSARDAIMGRDRRPTPMLGRPNAFDSGPSSVHCSLVRPKFGRVIGAELGPNLVNIHTRQSQSNTHQSSAREALRWRKRTRRSQRPSRSSSHPP